MSAIRLTDRVPGAALARADGPPRGRRAARTVQRDADLRQGRPRARGSLDVDGNELLDFAGGIGCVNVGHANAAVVEAATAQLSRLTHGCFHVTPYEGYVRLAERLNALVPGRLREEDASSPTPAPRRWRTR